jgi:hypothetical protein
MKIALLVIALLLLTVPLMAQTHVQLSWDLSADDALLGATGGYHLYASKTSGGYTATPIATTLPGVTTATIVRPGLGKYYFIGRAFASDGTEAPDSNEVSLVIRPAPMKLNTVQQIAQAIKGAVTKLAGLFSAKKNLRIVETS